MADESGTEGELVVRSSHASDHLRIWATSPAYQWRARLDLGDMTAEADVYERYSRDRLRLDAYFAGLAEDWRGWDGERRWEATGLALSARHDGLGHVALDVVLDHAHAEVDRWSVRGTLRLDAGGLDRLAVAARSLDRA